MSIVTLIDEHTGADATDHGDAGTTPEATTAPSQPSHARVSSSAPVPNEPAGGADPSPLPPPPPSGLVPPAPAPTKTKTSGKSLFADPTEYVLPDDFDAWPPEAADHASAIFAQLGEGATDEETMAKVRDLWTSGCPQKNKFLNRMKKERGT